MEPVHKLRLREVIACLPAACYANPTWKGLCYVGRDLTIYAAAVALLAYTDALVLLVPLWGLAALSISALFVLGHDAAHGALFRSRPLDRALARLTLLPALHPYEEWVLGHNRVHHGHTMRAIVDVVWHPLTPDQYRRLSWLGRALHRIEWSAWGAGLYYALEVWAKLLMLSVPPAKTRTAIQRDRALVTLYALGMTMVLLLHGYERYGTVGGAVWMWGKVFVVPWLLWNQVIGMTVYVHHIAPDIAWLSAKAWTKPRGQIEGTIIYRIPRWLNFFAHNILLHVPHHVDTRIPFYNLPAAAAVLTKQYPGEVRAQTLTFATYRRATRNCKLYNFEHLAWCTYASAARVAPAMETAALREPAPL